ncbi:T9SS type A sorting domain-containing protein [Candidatus Fermentibacteria bacterium]|nr:T9SS type A sorting domain-containing protein [Candidatus Fermentibacteria bacterium]
MDDDYTVLGDTIPLPDSAYAPIYMYMTYYNTTYDIAYEGYGNGTGDIWFATNDATSPIRAYNTSGELTYATNILPSVRGLAFYADGGQRYIWASCPGDSRLYLILLDPTGIGGEEEGAVALSLAASENPFCETTIISGTGFAPGALLEIFDVSGRKVLEAPFSETFVLSSGSVPAGIYVARVTDPSGATARLSITRL